MEAEHQSPATKRNMTWVERCLVIKLAMKRRERWKELDAPTEGSSIDDDSGVTLAERRAHSEKTRQENATRVPTCNNAQEHSQKEPIHEKLIHDMASAIRKQGQLSKTFDSLSLRLLALIKGPNENQAVVGKTTHTGSYMTAEIPSPIKLATDAAAEALELKGALKDMARQQEHATQDFLQVVSNLTQHVEQQKRRQVHMEVKMVELVEEAKMWRERAFEALGLSAVHSPEISTEFTTQGRGTDFSLPNYLSMRGTFDLESLYQGDRLYGNDEDFNLARWNQGRPCASLPSTAFSNDDAFSIVRDVTEVDVLSTTNDDGGGFPFSEISFHQTVIDISEMAALAQPENYKLANMLPESTSCRLLL